MTRAIVTAMFVAPKSDIVFIRLEEERLRSNSLLLEPSFALLQPSILYWAKICTPSP